MTADGAYDGEPVYRAVADRAPEAAVVIPPRATAKASAQADQAPTQRDRHIHTLAQWGGRGWQRATGYGRRSLAETAMFRYKTLIGRHLRARSLPGQKAEVRMGCRRDQSDNAPRHAGLASHRLKADERPNLPGRSARIDDLCTNALPMALPRWIRDSIAGAASPAEV